VFFDSIPANGCANGAPVSDPAYFEEDVFCAGSETGATGIKTRPETKLHKGEVNLPAQFGKPPEPPPP
jgi:hypothetical protein